MRVLLVEDDTSTRQFLARAIRLCGHEVEAYADGTSAWTAFEERDFPIVVSDWVVPGIDGLELCRRVRSVPRGDETFVLLITAFDDADVFESVLRAGADDYVAKPITLGILKARVRIAERRLQAEAARRAAEAATARASQQLRELAQKLEIARDKAVETSEQKSRFLGKVSHEVRTPLNGILGLASLLRETSLDAAQRDSVDTIIAAGESLVSVINELLDVARIEAGDLAFKQRPTDVRAVVRSVVGLLRPLAADKKLELGVVVAEAVPPFVLIDGDRLRQILVNLIGNAIKFTQEGRIDLAVSTVAPDPTLDGPERLQLRVVDTGVGIAPEDLERIFEPFAQVGPHAVAGTGLGLTISRQLAVAMGGSLTVQSAPREGSAFSCTLPLIAADAPSAVVQSARRELRGVRVLVVEDNPVNRKVARRLLDSLGCVVDMADDGNDALTKFDCMRFDLVLMDCEMPKLDGLEATRALRKLAPPRRVPIVAMTAAATDDDRSRCLEAGMDDHITKPVTLEQLRTTVSQWALAPDA